MKLFAMKSVIGWHMQKIKLFETWQLAQFELLSVEEHVFYLFNIGITLNLSSLCAICDHWQNYRLIKYHMCEVWFCVLALFYRNYGAIRQSSSANICSSIFNLSVGMVYSRNRQKFSVDLLEIEHQVDFLRIFFFLFVSIVKYVCLFVFFYHVIFSLSFSSALCLFF